MINVKKISTERVFIMGFDETNNGYGLKCFNSNHSSDLIITGYFSTDISMRGYHVEEFETKGRIFNGRRNIEKALRKGRKYLSGNPYFLYTSISKEIQKTTPELILRAQAIALLSINFFLRYNPDPSKTKIVVDDVNGREFSSPVKYKLDTLLDYAGLSNVPTRFMNSGASNCYAIRKADMVGYYLTAIHFLGENHKWPYRNKKIPFGNLEKSIEEFVERNQIF